MEHIEAREIALQTALEATMNIQASYGRAIAKARDILVAELDYTPGEAVMELFGSEIGVIKQSLVTWQGLQGMFPEQYGIEMQ